MLSQLHQWLCDEWYLVAKVYGTNISICGKSNFGKHNIFHRPDETLLLAMVKACLYLKIFCYSKTFENFVLLEYGYEQNEKPSFTYMHA